VRANLEQIQKISCVTSAEICLSLFFAP